MFGLKALSTGLFAAASVSGIQLWKTPGQIPTDVPARCRAALSTNITCDFLVTADSAANGEVVVGEAADVFCNSACRDSLRSFTSSVTSGCGHTQYKLWENSTMTASGQAMAEGLLWANSLLCIQDE
ncbi:hypothetical protein COL154_012288 [Colletotrichum chrysophilum]|uniref:uncharacterized protein n=1 Tax=Colletotrichum chrysophilum TaxID=1836956 RepID=UPI00230087A3|nr:uncharacterized protein COL26b_013647 [Colletotrichum chrysophilum]KAJ0352995.1 hypothetical protein COL154_012288 [Colletotrichum chrysophilum]KAJ0361673.1 hypothetical protein COL26b_013647 [Colletotrichum chrysophilum]